jgi:DNA-binding IclR family transcriptional regulator
MAKSGKKPVRKDGSAYSVEAVEHAVDVLMAFTHAEPEQTLSQVVGATKLPKFTVFHLLATLRTRHLC